MAGHSDDHYVPVSPVTEAKRLANRGDFDPPANGDDCVRCEGRNGGVPGNENMIDGEPVCDYCTAEELKSLDYTQKVEATVTRLKERRDLRVLVKRRRLATCLHIVGPGTYVTYTTFILPVIRINFPEACTISGWFTPEPWASDPYMKVTISLDPKEQETMKTVYQACDGEIFEDRATAVVHENELFDAWLDNLIEGEPEPTLSTVVHHFNYSPDLTCDNYYGTPWDLLKASLRMYWEGTLHSRLEHTTHPKERN
jgi:hypothetical protein